MRKYVLLALVMGCSTATSTAPHTGNLSVTVAAPAGLAQVTITGPGGFTKTITSSTTLAVAPGTYTVAATDLTSKDTIVATVYHATVTGSPATIAIGSTATVSVSFAVRPGSGALWVVGGSASGPNTANGAIGFTVAQLRASGSVTPAVHLAFPVTPGGNIDPNTVAVDPQGNLWVANDNSNSLVEYPVSALSASGSPTPSVTVQLPAGSVTDAMAFDTSGNLWAGNEVTNTIVEYAASQLTASGSPTPAVSITAVIDSSGTGGYPMALAFDSHGNLWVSNSDNYTITAYTPSQLTASGQVVPARILKNTASVVFPYGMAFDAAGNLWLATLGNLVELSAASLATSGTQAPAVILALPDANNSPITTIAFDNSGDLWYSDFNHATISELVPSQLSASGSVTPTVAIVYGPTPLFYGTSIAFSPHPAALPLH